MRIPVDTVQHAVDSLYKSHYGKMVSSLLNAFRGINVETVEDLVQDSFATALTTWTKEGLPSNPAGWIFTVGRNRVINKIKKEKKHRFLYENEDFNGPAPEFPESFFDDQQLKLLFACAHPDLSPKVQVVITLKYVVNLKVEAIAKALGMTIDGIDKLLVRTRKKIKDEKIFLAEPGFFHLTSRLQIVHKIIYLIFNEGYKPSWGEEIINEELCGEALLLTKGLLDNKIGDKVTAALYALMLFNAARFPARLGTAGELLDLEEQDRLLWNRPLISMACDFLSQSGGDVISPYHYEASIAYLHCSAISFQSTNWPLISDLYRQLLEMNLNPFVELNYAIALYYAGEIAKAFDILNTLIQHPFLNQYYPLNATLGKIYYLEGNYPRAREYLLRALGQTNLRIEKEFINKLMNKIKD
jgi:RNA polymerase sigma factor (sigma-70 family)